MSDSSVSGAAKRALSTATRDQGAAPPSCQATLASRDFARVKPMPPNLAIGDGFDRLFGGG